VHLLCAQKRGYSGVQHRLCREAALPSRFDMESEEHTTERGTAHRFCFHAKAEVIRLGYQLLPRDTP